MNVITENPIIYIGANDTEDAEMFLYTTGVPFVYKAPESTNVGGVGMPPTTIKPTTPPTPKQIEEAKKKGLNWDKVNKVFIQAKELGIVDSILGRLGITPRTQNDLPNVGVNNNTNRQPESQGMSTTTKVLIGVGIVGVLGLILYSVKSKSK
jgi:hypothetical protein